MRTRRFVTTLVALFAALTFIAGSAFAGGHWAGHGNGKWSNRTLTVGQARRAIAHAIAGQHAKLGGLRINPGDVKVSLKLGADGKTAVWRAEAKPRARDGRLAKLLAWGNGAGKPIELKGTIDISLRSPAKSAIDKRAFQISRGNQKSDWFQAEKIASRFGAKPRRSTIARIANQLYQRRAAGRDAHFIAAEKELKLDLYSGTRVKISDNAFRQTTKQLFGSAQ
ncbi:MAG: hypothetical protein KC503_37755 [Myxococcales bacterium]|nr:hypothetical protein [Myxococcales bacterium]